MSETGFELIAKVLVDQHYAAGPEAMKKIIAQALEEAAAGKSEDMRSPREQLELEVDQAIKASTLGSE